LKGFKAASHWAASLAPAAIVLALAWVPSAASADPTPISRAETLLFMTPHLKDVQPPSRLHYAFNKSGSLEKGFSDTVDLDITAGSDGKRKTAMRSFSSTSPVSSPEFENAETNPVLLFYLDREIAEMRRLTHGSTFHFSKQIRMALAESAQIKDVEIHFGGRTLRAQQITISPYESDPYRDRYPDQRLMAKQYIFTVCEAIPGTVYEVRGVVPSPGGSPETEAVIDERLTFASTGAPK
jgi:hypothetical protein